jgi:hypothetical protein
LIDVDGRKLIKETFVAFDPLSLSLVRAFLSQQRDCRAGEVGEKLKSDSLGYHNWTGKIVQ